MICPLLKEIEIIRELELIVDFFIDQCHKGKGRATAQWLRDILMAKWSTGSEMIDTPGYEESGRTISEHTLKILNQAGVIIR